MYGYYGKLLEVNLDDREIRELPLGDDILGRFVGGATLAARLVYSSVRKKMDPLGAENPLVFAVGPLTGTTVPMVSRSAVCGISPLTGIWGEATTGGVFPVRMKATGFDAIVIRGKARRPVYLYINNGRVEIRDASHLWGKDTYVTQQMIKDELKEKLLSVSCIGSAGENLVRYACVINDRGRAAGRTGMGALMGSKKLKAVAVAGNQKAAVANVEKARELSQKAREAITSSMLTPAYREYGTMFFMDIGMFLGDTPARYYTRSVFPTEKITGQAFRQAYTMDNYACSGCPIGCGRVIKNYTEDIAEVDGPEYETAAAFGPMCMNYDLDSIVYANHRCNAHGLDTISAGVCIAYAMHLFEKGVLTEGKAGIKITWGDGKVVMKLVDMIIKRKGIGKLLGEGVRRMAAELGEDRNESGHVKGLEIPMHDGRAYSGIAVSYSTGPRGACHLKGDYYNVDMAAAVPELGIVSGDRFQSEGKAVPAAKYQSVRDMYDALLLCKFCPLSLTQLIEIVNSVTGWQFTPRDFELAGERSLNIKRAINNRLGISRADDRLPRLNIKPLNEGSTAGKSPDMGIMLREYYEYRKWDWKTGKPTREKLLELGLNDVAADLWPSKRS